MLISQLHYNAETPANIRQRNRFTMLRFLRDHGPLSKSDLVELTNRTNTTIATIMDGLLDEKLVEIVDEDQNEQHLEPSRGRPAVLYRISRAHWITAGIQIASNSITVIIMGLDGTVFAYDTILTPENLASAEVLRIAGDLLQDVIERLHDLQMSLLGIGVALEGFVNPESGQSLWMLFRTQWKDVQVQAYFEERFHLPVVIEYRVFAAAIAEAAYGAARDIPDFVYLNIDTGVATATVASGQLVRSSIQPTGITGGLGHVLTTSSQKPCFCGNSGCLHNEITTQALTLQLKELLKLGRGHGLGEFWEDHEPTFPNLIEAINHQDALAHQLRTRFIEHLGVVVRAAIQLFSANLLIIGGPTIQFGGKQAIQAAQEAAQQLTILHELLGKTRVVASNLKPDSATVGAATLVVHALMNGQILPSVQESSQKVTLSTGGQ